MKGLYLIMLKHQIPTDFGQDVYRALESFDKRIKFRWDLQQDVITLNTPLPVTCYDLKTATIKCASSFLWHSGFILADDIYALQVYLHSIFSNVARYTKDTRNHSCKLRLRNHSRQGYIWSEIHLVTYYDDLKPVIAFGNIRNIQAQKIWQQRIERAASHDKLTGLLNKDSVKKRINLYLDSQSMEIDANALILIDADGFKDINDTFGHLFGDAVLADMGSAIEHNFRHSDFMGRIGGDEFIVLFRDLTDISALKERCQQLIESLKRNYKNGNDNVPFSISIGIARYPEHGTNYTELFKHADRALYEAKSRGKNQYSFYHNSLLGNASVTNHRSPDDFIELQQKAFKDNMIEFIFQLLYETNSPEATMSLTLGMFGKRFNLDRVAIDLFEANNYKYHNAYEWLSPNGIPLNETNSNASTDDIVAHYDMVLKQYKPTPYGVMAICEDVSHLDESCQTAAKNINLGAFAHCLISHGSETLGCIGFESSHKMEFNQEIINALSVFSVILGNILLPHDTSQQLKTQNNHLRDLLDHIQDMVYVIDKTTMTPIYYNAAMRQLLAGSVGTQTCYQLFHHRSKPCDNCPVLKLSSNGSEYLRTKIANWDPAIQTNVRTCNLKWTNENIRNHALVIQESI